ncbi:hypothetical protein [cf. Phormidesmis sp. LEGE 11477]|uniref:hypothetical protein n=1 Tax=cf. Phormidesmis sp. LEGE 11477 TaxID=1828680 RepID=UPI00187E67DA|nr:hypothetical protein [cf. Phormidesmis sp. LEGE 11477]MBE9063114.1 hypothetical protein [cf. Phormidesmis sp. LEGE 11477]
MSEPYVGVAPEPVSLERLEEIVDSCMDVDSWLFLRWPHRVLLRPVSESPETGFDCLEGQAFSQTRELRWKRKGRNYEVLLLSANGGNASLHSIGSGWQTKELKAKAYPGTETRFPRKVSISNNLDISQRYFIDTKTACVQFVALVPNKREVN